jgi:exonuclease III
MLDTITRYAEYTNIGTKGGVTAILTREHAPLTSIMQLSSRRGMEAELQGVWLVNIYTPSGGEKQQEKEGVFNVILPYLLRAIPTTTIVGRDFKCVLAKTDCTGHFNYSRALNELGFDLVDVWAAAPERGIYTHCWIREHSFVYTTQSKSN